MSFGSLYRAWSAIATSWKQANPTENKQPYGDICQEQKHQPPLNDNGNCCIPIGV
jgi:hypothetical protein